LGVDIAFGRGLSSYIDFLRWGGGGMKHESSTPGIGVGEFFTRGVEVGERSIPGIGQGKFKGFRKVGEYG
jgi:hypothetical protein